MTDFNVALRRLDTAERHVRRARGDLPLGSFARAELQHSLAALNDVRRIIQKNDEGTP